MHEIFDCIVGVYFLNNENLPEGIAIADKVLVNVGKGGYAITIDGGVSIDGYVSLTVK